MEGGVNAPANGFLDGQLPRDLRGKVRTDVDRATGLRGRRTILAEAQASLYDLAGIGERQGVPLPWAVSVKLVHSSCSVPNRRQVSSPELALLPMPFN
jgi:hypothetical protein